MNKTAALLAVAVLMAPIAVSAQMPDLPRRRAGLWEISMTMEKAKGSPTIPSTVCLDAATDRELMDYGLKLTEGKCKSLNSKHEGGSLVIEAECTFAGTSTKSRTVMSGDFQSAYTIHIESRIGGGDNPKVTRMTQTAAWKSADCPGMKPGDITLFGGVKMNIKQIKAMSGMIGKF